MNHSHEARVVRARGYRLPNGISQKCAIGRHKECAAGRCQCHCLHGQIPTLLDAITNEDAGEFVAIQLPSGGIAHVDPAIQPKTLTALDEMMKTVVKQTERETFQSCGIELERSKSNDEITFAGLTAGLGRRGTNQRAIRAESHRPALVPEG